MKRKINNRILIRTFFRSFLILSVCNYERMQNLGFLYIIAPALKALYPEKEARIEAYKRHLDFFNVHPYFATIPAGIVIKMEEEGIAPDKIAEMKMIISGPIAAVGDSLFWATWRPFSAIILISMAFLSGYIRVSGDLFELSFCMGEQGVLFLVLLYILIYNAPGLFIRLRGLMLGYREKTGVFSLLKSIAETRITENISFLGHLLISFTSVVLFVRDFSSSGRLIFLVGMSALSLLFRRRLPIVPLFYALVVISIILEFI